MSKLDDMREDIRLARLNNQSYRFMFGLFDFVKGLLKLLLLAFFAVGIWYLTYGYETTRPALSDATLASAESKPVSIGVSEETLSEERIAMLREFASKNRDGGSAAVQAESTIASAALPTVQSTGIAPATRDATTESELPLPDISAKALLADLEEKLGGKRVAEGDVEPIDNVPSVVESPIIQASISEPVLPVVDSENPVAIDTTAAIEATATSEILPEPVPEPVDETPDEPAADTSVASTDSVQDTAWIIDQNPEHYTIQIGSTTNRPFLERFEKSLPEEQPTAIFEMLIGQGPENTLTFGLFDTNEAATAALGNLSQRSRRYGAYVRKLSAIQKQVRDLGGDLAIAQKVGN